MINHCGQAALPGPGEGGKVGRLVLGVTMRGLQAGVAALAVALLPGEAAALSCADYAIRDAYWYHEGREETFILVHGAFSDLAQVSAEGVDLTGIFDAAKADVWTARFTGFQSLGRAFDAPFAAEVVLVFPDFSMIGGGYDSAAAVDGLPGQSGLVWLQDTGAGYRLVAELCQPLIDTDPASVKPALQCLAGGYCPQPG